MTGVAYSRDIYLVRMSDARSIDEPDLLAVFYDERVANKFAQDYLIWYFDTDSEKTYYSSEDSGYVFEGEADVLVYVEEARVFASNDVPNLSKCYKQT